MANLIKEEDLRLNIIVNGNEARKKIGDLTRATQDLVSKNRGLEEQRRKLKAAGREDSQQYKDLTAQIDANKAATKSNQKESKNLIATMQLSQMTLAELQKRYKELNITLRNATPGTKQFEDINNELREVNTRMSELRRKSKDTGGVMGKLGLNNISAVIGKLFIYYNVLRGIFGIFSGGFNKIKDFEQANINLSTILGVSATKIIALTKSALELGRTTEYTASQVTGLQTELAKLGFGEQTILQMQKPILQFATAVGAPLSEAAALAGATLRAFGLNASHTEEVLATMAIGTNKSALSFAYLNESMSIVAPVAKTFGFGIKDTVALLGTLANSGFDASSAATATRNILLNLADANGKLAKALGKPVRSLPDLVAGLKILDARGIDLSKTLELTDKRSVAAFNTFLNGTDTINELGDAIANTAGELKRIQEERLNSVQGSILLLTSAWEGLMLSFFNSKGIMKGVVDGLTNIIEGMTRVVNPTSIVESRINSIADTLIKEYDELGQWGFDSYVAARRTVNKKNISSTANRINPNKINSGLQPAIDAQRESSEFEQAIVIANKKLVEKKAEEEAQVELDAKNKAREALQKQQAAAAATYAALTEKEMSERIALKKKYLSGEIATEEEFNEQLLQLNIDALRRRSKSGQVQGKERLELEEQITTLLLQQRKQENDKLAKVEQARIDGITDPIQKQEAIYAQQQQKFTGNIAMLEQLAQNHARKITEIKFKQATDELKSEENKYKEARARIVQQHKDELSLANLSKDQKAQIKRTQIAELKEIDEQYYTEALEKVQKLFSSGQLDIPTVEGIIKSIDLESALLSDEEKKQLLEMVDALQKKLDEAKQKVGELGYSFATKSSDILGFTQEDWSKFFSNLEAGKFGADEMGMALKASADVASMAMDVYAGYDKMMTAKENAELKKYKKNNDAKKKTLESRLDAGLITQEQFNQETERMDAETDRKEEEIQIKQAKRQKVISIGEAMINTALGITVALASAPPPFNTILAAITAALGAAQIAMIAATPIPGAEEGGMIVTRAQDGKKFDAKSEPDKRGYIEKPTVITGENGMEYVIPNEAMNNPTARPIIDIFETVRKQGKLRDADFTALLPAIYSMPGRAAGGGISPSADVAGGSLPVISLGSSDISEILEILRHLRDCANTPTPAVVAMMGKGGLVEKMKEYERMKNRGKL